LNVTLPADRAFAVRASATQSPRRDGSLAHVCGVVTVAEVVRTSRRGQMLRIAAFHASSYSE
jgi:hypothetical protein